MSRGTAIARITFELVEPSPVARRAGHLNEVWFDDLDDLRARITFFEEVGIGGAADLVREATFLAVREDPSRPFWSAKRPLGVPFR